MDDCEDIELNRLMKGALESRCTFAFLRPRAKHRWLKWSATTLLAASLSIFALPKVMLPPMSSSVVDTIRLLSDADGIDLNAVDSQSPADMLLAWQDVPYTVYCSGENCE